MAPFPLLLSYSLLGAKGLYKFMLLIGTGNAMRLHGLT